MSCGEYTTPGEDTLDYLSRIHFTKATPLRQADKRGKVIKKTKGNGMGRGISFNHKNKGSY